MTVLTNLTQHDVIFRIGEKSVKIPPSGIIARVSQKTVRGEPDTVIGYRLYGDDCVITHEFDEVVEIPTSSNEYGEVENLPDPETGVKFIVSALVAQRVPHRPDIIIPNEPVRDEGGRVIGCLSEGHI